MGMVKKNISVTDQQDGWIKAQIETGKYGNESEFFRDLIRDCISRDAEIKSINAALVEGEQSGVSNKTVDEIWHEAETHDGAQNA